MDPKTFTIVFQKLEEVAPSGSSHEIHLRSEATTAEIDEIAELRRIVLEVTDPGTASYTTS